MWKKASRFLTICCSVHLILAAAICLAGYTVPGSSPTVPTPAVNYVVDLSYADQGATTSAGNKTIADFVAAAGSNTAVIHLLHTSGAANTSCTLDTSIDLSSKPNIFIKPDPGVLFTRATGDEIFTVYSPENILVSQRQHITSANMLAFTKKGAVHSAWWGARWDGTTDDTNAINYALGTLCNVDDRVVGKAIISSTITPDKNQSWIGSGGGGYDDEDGATVLSWNGGSSTMVRYAGDSGETHDKHVGIGMKGFRLDGNSETASVCLEIKDCQNKVFEDLYLTGASSKNIYFLNSSGAINGFHSIRNIMIEATGSSTGITSFGVHDASADGVTMIRFDNIKIDHEDGAGVWIDDISDGFTWIGLDVHRSDAYSGPGVYFGADSASSVCGWHLFVNPLVSAGIVFENAGHHLGTQILNFDAIDINTGVTPISGDGVGDIYGYDSLGRKYGRQTIDGFYNAHENDTMRLIYHDTGNNVLFTGMGAWKTVSASGTIVDANEVKGATKLYTGAVLNAYTALMRGETAGQNGVNYLSQAALSFVIEPEDTANLVYRIGMADSDNDPPTNGIWIEYDTAVDNYWHMVTASGGSETDTPQSGYPITGLSQWQIQVISDAVVFYHRDDNNRLYGIGATHTTNIPTVQLTPIFFVKTLNATTKSLNVSNYELGYLIDGYP